MVKINPMDVAKRGTNASSLRILSPAADDTSVSAYKVFSGTCAAGKTISIGYPANAWGPPTTTCTGGTFSVGINFYGTDGSRAVSFSQDGSSAAQRNVSYSIGNAVPATGFNCAVNAMVFNTDKSQIYVGGCFTSVGQLPVNRIARINPDGSLDPTFMTGAEGFDRPVNALYWDSSQSKLYVGGAFTSFTKAGVAVTLNRIARLNPDGTLDPTFIPPGAGFNGSYGIAVNAIQPDGLGNVYLGGNFTSFTNGTTSTQNYLTRLTPGGAVETAFVGAAKGFGYYVTGLTWDAGNSRLFVGGKFLSYNNGVAVTLKGITILSTAGVADTTFMPSGTRGFSYPFLVSIRQMIWDAANSKLYVGGEFTSYVNGATTSMNSLARLNADGTLDSAFLGAGDGPGLTATTSTYPVYAMLLDAAASRLYYSGIQDTYYNKGVS